MNEAPTIIIRSRKTRKHNSIFQMFGFELSPLNEVNYNEQLLTYQI